MKYYSDQKTLNKYSKDRSLYQIKPSCVAYPKTEHELREVIKFAKKNKLSIIPRGGGTGLSGAAIGNGIIIDFTKYFTYVYNIGKTTKLQSGILLKKLRPLIEKENYMIPSVPLHGDCAIGGNVSTRSVGPGTLKYGTMDSLVKSVRGVLSDGRTLDTSENIHQDIESKMLRLQKQIKKDKKLINYLKKRPFIAGGYNLKAFLKYKNIKNLITHLIVGSTGTLMLLTEVELSLPKHKEIKEVYLIYFKDYRSIQKTLNKLLRLKPLAIEYADKIVLDLRSNKYNHKNALGVLIVCFETKKNITNLLINSKYYKHIPKNKIKGLFKSRALALPKLEEKAKKLGYALPSIIDDTSFHPKDFSKIMTEVDKYALKNNITISSFGHIGFGSLHLRPFLNIKKNPRILEKISLDIFNILKKYNGTLIGEHNSGPGRSWYLEKESKLMYSYMKKVKKIFDPENILNPKAMFNLDPITKNIKYN